MRRAAQELSSTLTTCPSPIRLGADLPKNDYVNAFKPARGPGRFVTPGVHEPRAAGETYEPANPLAWGPKGAWGPTKKATDIDYERQYAQTKSGVDQDGAWRGDEAGVSSVLAASGRRRVTSPQTRSHAVPTPSRLPPRPNLQTPHPPSCAVRRLRTGRDDVGGAGVAAGCDLPAVAKERGSAPQGLDAGPAAGVLSWARPAGPHGRCAGGRGWQLCGGRYRKCAGKVVLV